MDKEPLKLSIRKFLKKVGVRFQREMEMEHALARAIASKAIAGRKALPATMTLEISTTIEAIKPVAPSCGGDPDPGLVR